MISENTPQGTYGLIVKLAESVQDFCDHGCPCRYVFGLGISLEFCVVLQDAQTEPACAMGIVSRDMNIINKYEAYGSNLSATCGRAV